MKKYTRQDHCIVQHHGADGRNWNVLKSSSFKAKLSQAVLVISGCITNLPQM